jgi:hypothetical protein
MREFLKEIKYDAGFIRDHELQPRWYKILKVFLLIGLLGGYYLFFGAGSTLIFCIVFFGLSLLLHMIYRVRTEKYTRSWLDFKVELVDGELRYQRIGVYYYLAVLHNLALAVILSQTLI